MVSQNGSDSDVSEFRMNTSKTVQYVGFSLDEQSYAFPIEKIQEIVVFDGATAIPQVPDYVEGISNLRGIIIPAINLRRLLGLEARSFDHETRMIIVCVGEKKIGCIVDSVTQVMKFSAEDIQKAPELVTPQDAAYVRGFTNINDRLVTLLEIDHLLAPDNLDSVHRSAVGAQSQEPGTDAH